MKKFSSRNGVKNFKEYTRKQNKKTLENRREKARNLDAYSRIFNT